MNNKKYRFLCLMFEGQWKMILNEVLKQSTEKEKYFISK